MRWLKDAVKDDSNVEEKSSGSHNVSSDDLEFSLNESTYGLLLEEKRKSGFEDKSWDEWFLHIFDTNFQKTEQQKIEGVVRRIFYDTKFENWVSYFAENLENIWNESSANEITESNEKKSALVIGRGPSIRKHKHLEMLAKSNYKGAVVCTDAALVSALQAGVTPEKFPNFYVVTIDTLEEIKDFYQHELVDKYGSKIKGIFSILSNPLTVEKARKSGIKIHWLHTLFDYNEGKKSFNQISASIINTKRKQGKLPAIQTGGNVGTSAWFVSWKILKCANVGLIGINHGWEEDDPIEKIMSHGYEGDLSKLDKNSPSFRKLFPKIYNPEVESYCILDPIFQQYSTAFKEFIARSPEWVQTINATQGGSIFGERVTCMKFSDFLQKY